MLKVGITGGIGSGKTVVCQAFETLGIPVFYADSAARWLMEHDAALIKGIEDLFGREAYEQGKLNRSFIASQVFNDQELLQLLNALTHPATIRYAREWMDQQTSPYAIKEAAIFFESGTNVDMDFMIGIHAPLEVRIERAIQRDSISREAILARISKQMDQEEKMRLCDATILNDGVVAVLPQVLELHERLLSGNDRYMIKK